LIIYLHYTKRLLGDLLQFSCFRLQFSTGPRKVTLINSGINPLLRGKTCYYIGNKADGEFPNNWRLMIENQINNDQNNHRYTQQPANNIFTYFHDTSPLPYSFNSCLIYGLWLTFKLAATRHHDVSC